MELALLRALCDPDVRALALRAQRLSAESMAAVRDLIERVRELEGLLNDRRHADAAGVAAEAHTDTYQEQPVALKD